MLYSLNGNLINIMEVVAVECSPSRDASYPYLLTVKMKSGNSYGVKYATEEGRRRELFSIRDNNEATAVNSDNQQFMYWDAKGKNAK